MAEQAEQTKKTELREPGKTRIKNSSLVAIALVALILSTAISIPLSFHLASDTIQGASSELMQEVYEVTASYEHSFLLFEQILQQELRFTSDTDEIEAYLKSMDKRLLTIEGEDYDGIYLYYKGQYLYSWDTPYEVYEKSGYDARTRPWYIGAVAAGGKLFMTNPYVSYANDYMLATISRLQSDGETVIAYDIKMSNLQKLMDSGDALKRADVFLCDHTGSIISSSDPVYLGENYTLTIEELTENVAEATALEKAESGTDQWKKAQYALQAAQATLDFKNEYGTLLERTNAHPGALRFDFTSRSFGYLYESGAYDCLMILSAQNYIFMEGVIWLISFFLILAAGLILENELIRRRHIKMMQENHFAMKQALAAADAANVAKSQFLAQMSHEIRTPMNAVIGLTSIARSELHSPEKVEGYLRKIEGSSKLLLGIINDVLDMSSIAGGKMKIDSSPFNFKQLIMNITAVFYHQAKRKSIRFEVKLNDVTEEILVGDELRVNQVLMNLLSNAVKFTPPGGRITLAVVQASRSSDRAQMRFSVSDTGCGMSEDMMQRLFRPFEQESPSTARKHGGSGLGLSITKNLVEMMGGGIRVESKVGQGSVFTVDIPFVLRKEQPSMRTAGFAEIRTLVVDDDVESCQYSGVLLERMGVRYDYVTDGAAALEALGEAEDAGEPYKLCLIDWKMPDMDGVTVTRRIREVFGEDTIVIIVSAYDLSEVQISAKAAGANYFVTKPLFQSTLFNTLARITGEDAPQASIKQEISRFQFSGKKVLLAEDVALNMEVAVKLLQKVGVEAVCAEDGQQAVALYQKFVPGTFDCILMDVNMPVMDGYEATRRIRESGREDAETVPIFAMTANAFSEDVANALNAGMNGHIAKPIETRILFETLKTAFEMKQRAQTERNRE